MAYRCHKNFFRKSKLNLKTPLAYRCHKNFFRKSKLNLKTIDQYALRSEEDILLQQSGPGKKEQEKWLKEREKLKK